MLRLMPTWLVVAAALALASTDVEADTLGSREHQRGAITRLTKGAFQLGVESSLILAYNQQGDDSSFRANTLGSAAFRYFYRDNIGLSARLGGLYRKTGEVRDTGFVGALWANYYFRLGEGMFFSPGAGLGMLFAERSVPITENQSMRATLVGGVVAAEFNLAVFLNRRFSLTAGPEVLVSFGGTSPEMGEGDSFFALDGGFKVGAAYAF
jgi:hypothetical protein